jgi:hypothetical protein
MAKCDDDLREFAAHHLIYEVEMVAGLVWRLLRHQALFLTWDGDANPLMKEIMDMAGRNADIESFGLHTRILVDFLYDQRGKETDAIARDYVNDPSAWQRARPKKPRDLKLVNERVGIEVAHLSYLRSAPSKDWPYPKIWDALRSVLREFVSQVDPDRAGKDVIERMREVLEAPITDPQHALRFAALARATTWTPIVPPMSQAGTATAPVQVDFPATGD